MTCQTKTYVPQSSPIYRTTVSHVELFQSHVLNAILKLFTALARIQRPGAASKRLALEGSLFKGMSEKHREEILDI